MTGKLGSRFCLHHGFALAEIMIALFVVTLATFLVGGLGQQIMQFSKSAKQTGAVVELRSKSLALVRDSDKWLAKLRGMPNFAVYNACFPEENSTSTSINCPTADLSIFESSPGLNDVASGYVGISAPLIDLMGSKIAGTEDDPLYITADGSVCSGPPKSCALRSIAYFLRTTTSTSTRPSTVRFVVRIDKNPLHTVGSLAMKPQYITMDVSTQTVSSLCDSGSLKLGTLVDGKPYCVTTTSGCSSGKVALGVNNLGVPICENVPSCNQNSRYIVLNPNSGNLECTPNPSPCPPGSPYLGNFSGTNTPICSNGLSSCPNGVMLGVEEQNGSLVNKCVPLPEANCTDENKTITFDGDKFVCGIIRDVITTVRNDGSNGQNGSAGQSGSSWSSADGLSPLTMSCSNLWFNGTWATVGCTKVIDFKVRDAYVWQGPSMEPPLCPTGYQDGGISTSGSPGNVVGGFNYNRQCFRQDGVNPFILKMKCVNLWYDGIAWVTAGCKTESWTRTNLPILEWKGNALSPSNCPQGFTDLGVSVESVTADNVAGFVHSRNCSRNVASVPSIITMKCTSMWFRGIAWVTTGCPMQPFILAHKKPDVYQAPDLSPPGCPAGYSSGGISVNPLVGGNIVGYEHSRVCIKN